MAAEGMDGSSLMEGQESEPCITLNLHPLDSQECKNNLFDEQMKYLIQHIEVKFYMQILGNRLAIWSIRILKTSNITSFPKVALRLLSVFHISTLK